MLCAQKNESEGERSETAWVISTQSGNGDLAKYCMKQNTIDF